MKCVLGILATLTFVLVLGVPKVTAAETGPVSAPLEPMAKPAMHVGDKETWRNKKGKEWTRTLVEMDENTATFEDSDGCTFTQPHEVFAQWLKWTNCPRDGSGTTSLTKGDIWPLETGKKWWYKYAGSNKNGQKWKGKMSCQVKGEVRVKVPAGTFDTFRVVCNTKRIKRQYYISPEIKRNVMYKWTHKYGQQPARTHKLVSYSPEESG